MPPNPFLGPLVVAASTTVFVGFARRSWFALQSQRWPTTMGHIVHSDVVPVYVPRGGGGYVPDIQVCYEVAGKSYRSDNIGYQGLLGAVGSVGPSYSDRFPHGATVPVWYDPANPSRSVLIPGASSGNWLAVATAAAVWVSTLVFSWWLYGA